LRRLFFLFANPVNAVLTIANKIAMKSSRTFRYAAIAFSLLAAGASKAQLKLDSSFNSLGYNIVSGSGNSGFDGRKAITLADGSLLIAGFRGNNADSLSVLKLQPGGMVDRSFGTGGYSSVYAGGLQVSQLNIDIVVQRDRKIVVMAGGQHLAVPANNIESSILLMRLNAGGSPDLSFGNNGLLTSRPDPGYEFFPLALALDTTGAADKYYVSSLATENGNANCSLGYGRWCVCRYDTHGVPDLDFNNTGYILETSSNLRQAATKTPMALVLALKVLPSGKLMAAGAYNIIDSAYFTFRLNADGSFDPAFGTNGRTVLPASFSISSNYQETSAQILKDGSVLFSTHHDLYETNGTYDSSRLYITKCIDNGSIASGFGKSGTLVTYYSTEGHHQLAVDSSNRIWVSWNRGSNASQYMYFRCFTSAGLPDVSFASSGYSVVEPRAHDTLLYASIYHTLWTSDNSGFIVLERRFNVSYSDHPGVFRYKLPVAKSTSTSIATSGKVLDAVVYPVPAHDVLIIKVADAKQARAYIVDELGNIALQAQLASGSNVSLDVSRLARGTYVLHLTDEAGGQQSRKIVLE
jgi:uncharacterized delta-60 repeat protein